MERRARQQRRRRLHHLQGIEDSVFLELTVGHPEVHWMFHYTARKQGCQETFEFNDEPVKEVLAEVPLTHPDVLAYLRETLEEGLGAAQKCLNR